MRRPLSEFERAQNRLQAIGAPLDPKGNPRLLAIKAPITGSVIDLQMAPGAFLNDPTAPVMTIADLSTVWVTANVPEKDTALVSKGQSVDVVFTAYPDEVFKGTVLFVSDVLEPDTRRTKVRIAFANPDIRLKPNMFANATFIAPPRPMPVVPTKALILRERVRPGVRRGRALGVRGPSRRGRLPAGRRRRRGARPQGRGSCRRQGRGAPQ